MVTRTANKLYFLVRKGSMGCLRISGRVISYLGERDHLFRREADRSLSAEVDHFGDGAEVIIPKRVITLPKLVIKQPKRVIAHRNGIG